VSQVSRAMKMLKATCIEAMDQPCFAAMGLTKSVHPYCRLAIITMLKIAQASIVHRVPLIAIGRESSCAVTAIVFPPRFLNYRSRNRRGGLGRGGHVSFRGTLVF
jgi:hypothetical protein